MSIPSAWPLVLDFYGTPLVIEASPGQLSSDAGLPPRRSNWRVYARLGRWDRAVADFTEAIRLNRDFADAWFHRGVAYAGLSRWDLAAVDLPRALELNPDHLRS